MSEFSGITGHERRSLTLKSYGLTLSVDDAPGQHTEVTMDDSENLHRVNMQLDQDEVRMLIGFLQATLD